MLRLFLQTSSMKWMGNLEGKKINLCSNVNKPKTRPPKKPTRWMIHQPLKKKLRQQSDTIIAKACFKNSPQAWTITLFYKCILLLAVKIVLVNKISVVLSEFCFKGLSGRLHVNCFAPAPSFPTSTKNTWQVHATLNIDSLCFGLCDA